MSANKECCQYFNYSLNSFVYSEDGPEDELEVTYEVEGWYHPIVEGTYNKSASDDIEYYGMPAYYDWEILKVINRTDEREIPAEWIYDSDVHDMIVEEFEKEHKEYFKKEVDTDIFEC